MTETTRDDQALVIDLRKAIEHDELILFYQPQIDLRTGRADGVEALVRWLHPTLGLLPPDRFIPLAEQSDLIVRLTEWVFRTACRQAASWQAGGHGLEVSVNVSPREFLDPQFVDFIKSALCDSGCEYGDMSIELTENAPFITNSDVLATMHKVRDLGVKIAVDDFGKGYSSLSSLRCMPIDILKIDRSFVRGLSMDDTDKIMLRAIIELAHGLKLKVVAEGIETDTQRDVLSALGCDVGQGYFFGRPVHPENLEALLAKFPTQVTGVASHGEEEYSQSQNADYFGARTRSARNPLTTSAQSPVNILLVDDRNINLDLLEQILAPLGHNLVRANSGEEALRRLIAYDFAIILLDVMMPGMDGFQTMARFKELGYSPNTPVIFITVSNEDGFVSEGYSLGAIDYIRKPLDPTILQYKVSAFVNLYRKTRSILATETGRTLGRTYSRRSPALTEGTGAR